MRKQVKIDDFMKGIRFGCRNKKCENDSFLVTVNFKSKRFRLNCSKCGKLLYWLQTDKEMFLSFEKDYIEDVLSLLSDSEEEKKCECHCHYKTHEYLVKNSYGELAHCKCMIISCIHCQKGMK